MTNDADFNFQQVDQIDRDVYAATLAVRRDFELARIRIGVPEPKLAPVLLGVRSVPEKIEERWKRRELATQHSGLLLSWYYV